MSTAWSNIEVELCVSSYIEMLEKELTFQDYSKAEHRRALLPLLVNRTEGSIEFKHQNISAVLIRLGQPYIKGYLPRYNYQKILEEKVIDYLKSNSHIESIISSFVSQEVADFVLNTSIFNRALVDSPKPGLINEPVPSYRQKPIKINYLEREQRNSKLGELGEKFILEYEKWKLIQSGKESLADKVLWVSKEEGDGAGFDILSRNNNGSDKYIEVKTTRLGKETPIYFSKNELQFSQQNSRNFHLFRLFDFSEKPRFFTKNGVLDEICQSEPINYKGYF